MPSSFVSLVTLVAFTTCVIISSVAAAGEKGYQEECSMLSQVTNLFTGDKADESKKCNEDKGLHCVGDKCQCTPGKTYEKGLFGTGLFGQGKCVGAANRPCLPSEESSRCVANSECNGQGIGLCICKEGYSATSEGHCSNGAFRAAGPSSISIYLISLFASAVLYLKY